MTQRRKATGQFELPVPAADAIFYFTPEGERPWAPGWDPTYPSGEATETPGTVFITVHGDTETFWVIENIDRRANMAAYSRVTPGQHAGTVRVRCDDQPGDTCMVTVEYDMTSLDPEDPHLLDHFEEESFAAMMEHWATAVSAVLPT